MGLDMYLVGDDYIPSFGDHVRPKRDGYDVTSYRLDMGYWRKYAPLHCFIVENYADGEDDCREVHLDPNNLLEIAAALRAGDLPPNEECHGFFFGDSEWWDQMRADGEAQAKIFEDAARWVEQGSNGETWRSVYYQASW